jgi:hypothetical protein
MCSQTAAATNPKAKPATPVTNAAANVEVRKMARLMIVASIGLPITGERRGTLGRFV